MTIIPGFPEWGSSVDCWVAFQGCTLGCFGPVAVVVVVVEDQVHPASCYPGLVSLGSGVEHLGSEKTPNFSHKQ